MKIYVDGEMPKSCNGCPFQDYETNTCCVDNGISCAWKDERRAKNCPLQSLAEHDKALIKKIKLALRKQVCQMQDDEHFYPQNVVCWQDVVAILDQIENDSEVQNGK